MLAIISFDAVDTLLLKRSISIAKLVHFRHSDVTMFDSLLELESGSCSLHSWLHVGSCSITMKRGSANTQKKRDSIEWYD